MKTAAMLTMTCLFLITASASGEEIQWRDDFRKAAIESNKTKKPMLVKITAPWCGYCHKMAKTTYKNKTVVQHVNKCFIPVTINADDNKKLVDTIGIKGLPTTVIISPDLDVVKKITGFKTASQLEKQLAGICPDVKPVSAEEMQTQFKTKPVSLRKTIAFDGICLVSLREDRKIVTGERTHKLSYHNYTLHFASAEKRQKFLAEPEKYWPVLDGHCPVSSMSGNKEQLGNPRWGALYQDRIWFFADEDHRNQFVKAPGQFQLEETTVE